MNSNSKRKKKNDRKLPGIHILFCAQQAVCVSRGISFQEGTFAEQALAVTSALMTLFFAL